MAVTAIYCTGAVHVFAAIPSAGGNAPTFSTLAYIGTCQQMPQPQDEYQYEPAMNDLGGRKTPLDEAYQGCLSAISLDFTRWSETNLSVLKSPPFYSLTDGSGAALAGGITSKMARGALTIQQGCLYNLFLVNDFWLTPQLGAPADLSPGRFYFACKTIGRYMPISGTAPAMQRLEVGVIDAYRPTGGLGVPARGFFDWTEDPSKFPSQSTFNALIT